MMDYGSFFPFFGGLFAGGIILMLVLMLGLYVYSSMVLMTIAKKTKTKNPWMAWIPVANIYLMTQIAGLNGLWTLAILLPLIPFIGSLAMMGVIVWWWWKIAEKRKFPAWLALLMLIPLVNLIVMGVIAWGKK
ncbi:MAG TPA: hypothetical protein VJC39_04170 [Candidatus Nanoarchaeia archaeon]|nr:hypothetical protein [Candidatus Nanoarchaeia archaeon]